MKKTVFLDIDGTLVDFQMKMPESTYKAINRAKENGHKIVLCTGRTYSNIYPWLLDVGFDGVVASAGAYVICKGEVIFHNTLQSDEVERMTHILESHKACYMLQGINGRYIDNKNAQKMQLHYEKMGADVERVFSNMTICEAPWKLPNLESGMYFHADRKVNEMQKAVGEYIKITGSSFGAERDYSGEMTCMGINKATGMKCLMDHMGIAGENSIAIGDGPNDVEMMDYASTAVAMGNATEKIKRHADMITSGIDQDGIYYAFKKLGII